MQPNHTNLPIRRYITHYSQAQQLHQFRQRMASRLAHAIANGQTRINRGKLNG